MDIGSKIKVAGNNSQYFNTLLLREVFNIFETIVEENSF